VYAADMGMGWGLIVQDMQSRTYMHAAVFLLTEEVEVSSTVPLP